MFVGPILTIMLRLGTILDGVLRPLRVGCMLPHAGGREPAHRACGTPASVAQGGDTATSHESKLCLRRVDFFRGCSSWPTSFVVAMSGLLARSLHKDSV